MAGFVRDALASWTRVDRLVHSPVDNIRTIRVQVALVPEPTNSYNRDAIAVRRPPSKRFYERNLFAPTGVERTTPLTDGVMATDKEYVRNG